MHGHTHARTNSSVDVSFTTDGSIQARLTHINTVIVTLQILNGPGTGCPAASTTLCAQQKDLQNGGTAAPAPSPSPRHPHPHPPPPQRSSTLTPPIRHHSWNPDSKCAALRPRPACSPTALARATA